MLTPDQVLPFLQHPQEIVWSHALQYFHDASDIGSLTADHLWQAIDRFGLDSDSALSFLAHLDDVPQTEASYTRLIQALRAGQKELSDFHLQHVIGSLDFALVRTHREELLACEVILPHVRDHLRQRLELADQPVEPLWDRLMEHGRNLGNAYAGQFDERLEERLIEALARQPEAFIDRALSALDDPACAEDWREIFAVMFLGKARVARTIDALVAKLGIDADVLRERANDALSRIGTVEVVHKLEAFYPGKRWDVRLYVPTPIARIKRPQSEEALLRLLNLEQDEDLAAGLAQDLNALGSLRHLDRARQIIADDPDHPESLGICQGLLAVGIMTGTEIPEASAWRKKLARRDAGKSNLSDVDFLREWRDNWRRLGHSQVKSDTTGDSVATDFDLPPVADRMSDPDMVQPIRRAEPKIGRNDPCPCGSGKKYKKCCGK